MIKQNINIIGYQVLYDILDEIKNILPFKVYNYKDEKDYSDNLRITEEEKKNSFFIFKKINNTFLSKLSLNQNQTFIYPKNPTDIFKLIEIINIKLIRQKYIHQSNVTLKDYILDINSREIRKDNKKLKLTEKEIDTILFLNNKKKPQSIKILLSEVWGYMSDIETHTVETHIYRLRKKILNVFKDENFIESCDEGYQIL